MYILHWSWYVPVESVPIRWRWNHLPSCMVDMKRDPVSLNHLVEQQQLTIYHLAAGVTLAPMPLLFAFRLWRSGCFQYFNRSAMKSFISQFSSTAPWRLSPRFSVGTLLVACDDLSISQSYFHFHHTSSYTKRFISIACCVLETSLLRFVSISTCKYFFMKTCVIAFRQLAARNSPESPRSEWHSILIAPRKSFWGCRCLRDSPLLWV